jgi:hypothetical protein
MERSECLNLSRASGPIHWRVASNMLRSRTAIAMTKGHLSSNLSSPSFGPTRVTPSLGEGPPSSSRVEHALWNLPRYRILTWGPPPRGWKFESEGVNTWPSFLCHEGIRRQTFREEEQGGSQNFAHVQVNASDARRLSPLSRFHQSSERRPGFRRDCACNDVGGSLLSPNSTRPMRHR